MKDLILTIIIAFMLVVCLIDIVHDTHIYHKRRKAEQRRLLRRHEKAMRLQALADKQREAAAATEKAQDTFDKLTESMAEFSRSAGGTSFIPATDETKIKVEDELEYMPTIEVDGTNLTSEELLARAVKIEAPNKADTNAVQQLEESDVADEKLYTLTEIEPIVGLAHRTLVKYVNEGKIKATKIDRLWRVSKADLIEFMNGRKTE